MPDLPNTITLQECGLCLGILTGLIVLLATSSLFGSTLVTLFVIATAFGFGRMLHPGEQGSQD